MGESRILDKVRELKLNRAAASLRGPLGRDAAWLTLSHGVTAALQILIVIVAVRSLSPMLYGEYATAVAVVSIVEGVLLSRSGDLALHFLGAPWMRRDFREAWRAAQTLLRHDCVVLTGASAVVVAGGFAFAAAGNGTPVLLMVLATTLPAQIGYSVAKCVFIVDDRLRQQSQFEIAYAVLHASAACGAVVRFGVWGLVGAYLVSTVVKTGVAWSIARKWHRSRLGAAPSTQTASPSNSRALWRIGAHALVRHGFRSIASHADVVLLSAAQGNAVVATYKAAKSLAMLPARVAGPFWAAARPRLLEVWQLQDGARIRRLVAVPALLMAALLVVTLVPAGHLASGLLQTLYGTEYRDAGTPFLILLAGSWLFHGVTAWIGFWIVVAGDNRLGTLLFGVLGVTVLGLGAILGVKSATAMAAVVSASLILGSVLAWIAFGLRTCRMSGGLRLPTSCDTLRVGQS